MIWIFYLPVIIIAALSIACLITACAVIPPIEPIPVPPSPPLLSLPAPGVTAEHIAAVHHDYDIAKGREGLAVAGRQDAEAIHAIIAADTAARAALAPLERRHVPPTTGELVKARQAVAHLQAVLSEP